MARDDPRPPNADASAFTEVVNVHWSAVYRLLYSMTGNRHDTEDLTQETFLRALDRWTSFTAGTNLRAWLLRIATNVFLDAQRKRQKLGQKALPDDVPGRSRPPEQAAEAAEQTALLRAALEDLTETTRLVFHLRTQEELSFREIGEMVGISEDAARWHMHQARGKLMARLAGKV